MLVIETTDLSKRYRRIVVKGGVTDTTAVDHVSFTVEQGQVFGFLGPNGSGKTTTIGMLVGIISPTAGNFRLFGGSTPDELHQARRRIGGTLEYPNFYPYMSGLGNLKIVANIKRKSLKDVEEALEIVGMSKRQKSLFRTYSLGMKQRLAVAATLLGNPELVILDEPANGLDPDGMREIREIIGRLADRGTTIFLSSHLLWEVERTCSHVAIIKEGRLLEQGAVADVTSGAPLAVLKASDMQVLEQAVSQYPESHWVKERDGYIVAELETDDLATLNRYLAEQVIYVSELKLQQRSLEDVFMEVTGGGEQGMGVVA